jgi:sugar lactone lactonase YvrE
VYWVNLGYGTSLPGSVMRVAKSGGEPQLLAIEPEFPASLVVDDEAVYWTASGGKRGGTGAVMRVTKTGGKPVALVTGLYWPDELEQDDDFLYWTEAFVGVERVAKRGGTRSILVPGMTLSSGLAVDRDRVYFADYDTGWILSVAKTGGPVTRIAAVHSLDIPFFAVDGEFVYWHVGRGEVLKVPTSGGAPCVLFSSDHKLMDFVVTPDDLYIADMGDPVDLSDPLGMRPGSGAIRRITRTGGGNTPVTPPAVGNEAVAVDAQNVYWTNQSWTGLSTGTLNAIGR